MLARSVVVNGVLDVKIIEEKIKEELAPTECLIETYVSLISPGTELSRVFGLKIGATYPMRPGYCSVGKVLKIGSAIKQVAVGDTVLFSGPHSSLIVYDYTTSDGGILYKLDPKTDPIDGALLNMAWIALNGILPVEVKLGDTVVVLGLGILGQLVSLYYQQMGARVLAVEPVHSRAALGRKLGIKEVIDVPISEQYQTVMEKTNQQGAEIVVDATGLSVVIETGLKLAAMSGQVVLLGSPRTPHNSNVTDSFSLIHMKLLTVIGALNRRYPQASTPGTRLTVYRMMHYLEGLLQSKEIDAKQFISHIIKPDETALLTAYQGLMHEKELYTGVIIDWRK